MDVVLEHECRLRERLFERIESISSLHIIDRPWKYGKLAVLSVVSEKGSCETIGEMLAENGVCVRTGLHCAPLAHETAGTLETGTIRVSVSVFTKERDIYWLLREIREMCR